MEVKSRRIWSAAAGTLNLISFFYVLTFAFVREASIAADVFAFLAYFTILFDLIYAAQHGIAGWVVSAATMVLYAVQYFGMLLTGLSVFALNVSVVGILALLALFAGNAVFAVRMRNFRPKATTASNKFARTVSVVAACSGGGLLVALCGIGIATIGYPGSTPLNSSVANMALFLAALAVFALITAWKGLKATEWKLRKILAAAAICLTSVAVVPFLGSEAAAVADVGRAEASFVAAFGRDSATVTEDRMLQRPYSLANAFVGVLTTDYRLTRDVVYYTPQTDRDKLTLRYDVYEPTFEGAHRAALINLHGSGGDKDIGNYAHLNKYYASRGYVVFDLQFGDFNERDTGFYWEIRDSEHMLDHIDRFFAYASAHNDVAADFDNTFITGISMGGGLASKYAYSYPDNLTDYGVTLKGIVPVAPGYSPEDEGLDNYLNYVTKDSVPCLIAMGSGDSVVRTETLRETADAFAKADNPYCVTIAIGYAGHGSNDTPGGRANQLIVYYAERFMALLRSDAAAV